MFYLIAHFTDNHKVKLNERYQREFDASRAADNYIKDFSDPCQLGVSVTHVSICQEM